MEQVSQERLDLSTAEAEILVEALEGERTKLLVEIRRTDHRAYRDELRGRLDRIEALLGRLQKT